ASTAVLPPLSRPRLRGHLELGVLEGLRWISRNGIEAPDLLTGLGVVGGDVTANAVVLGPAIADDHLSAHDSWGAADAVHGLSGRQRLSDPDWLAGRGV